MSTKRRYAVVLAPDMVGRPIHLPAGCRVLERAESSDVLEDEGGPAAIVEWCNDEVDPLDVPGIVEVEPL